MGIPAVTGATLYCTMGQTGTLVASTQTKVLIGGIPAATIQDVSPLVNIQPCGMCISIMNPAVSAATSAALGVLTPMPCIPAPIGTWLPPSGTIISGIPALTNEAKLGCSYGGSITIMNPGQSTVIF